MKSHSALSKAGAPSAVLLRVEQAFEELQELRTGLLGLCPLEMVAVDLSCGMRDYGIYSGVVIQVWGICGLRVCQGGLQVWPVVWGERLQVWG